MKMKDDELIAIFRLARTVGLGAVTYLNLLRVYDNAILALEGLETSIRGSCGRSRIKHICTKSDALRELDMIATYGAKIIPYGDVLYPKNLMRINSAPIVLTVLGDCSVLNIDKNVAIVGSRAVSSNNYKFTQKIAFELACHGFVITSGLALGVDTAAHSVIYRKKPTIAVMPCGIGVVYPMTNDALYRDIVDNGGVVITEDGFGAVPCTTNFPRRNRIIAALSKGVLVVEAGINSGALITAEKAIMYDIPVFVVPSTPFDGRNAGGHKLIKDGAKLIENADDIVSLLSAKEMWQRELRENQKIRFKYSDADYSSLKSDLNVADIMAVLDYVPLDIEEISSELRCHVKVVLSLLVELDLCGMISFSDDGRVYKLV